MNENINLCDILKNCPKGTKLFSYIHGEVEFLKIDKDESRYKIVVIGKTKEGTEYTETFTAEGILNHRFNGICTLVPSKDQPDWNKFIAPWYKNEKLVELKKNDDGNKDFCCSQLFLHLKPVKHVIDFVKNNFDLNEVYICSAVANSVVWDEKNQWLDKYFPEIPKQNRLFVGNKDYKHVFVKNYCAMRNWPLNTVTLIDDYHPTIQKCEKLGINCVHPSNIESIVDKYSYQS